MVERDELVRKPLFSEGADEPLLHGDASPTSTRAAMDVREVGKKAGKRAPGQDIAVESDLGGLPTLDDGEQAGDATYVSTREGPLMVRSFT